MPVIQLPDIPSLPVEVEDCASALFSAAGYHVQRSVIERGDLDDVLELDTVATDYRKKPARRILAEAKSGGWGYAELFKVAGWMKYLDVPEGVFIVSDNAKEKTLDAVNERMKRLSIQVIHLKDGADFGDLFKNAGLCTSIDPTSYEVWRYFYAMERALLKYVRARKKGDPQLKGPVELMKYYDLINNEVFLQPDPYERLRGLYDAFKSHPKLSLGIAREIDGKGFDCTGTEPNSPAMKAAIYDGGHDLLQAAFYLEHRARLEILRTAVDLDLSGRPPKAVLLKGGKAVVTEWDFLPPSFQQGLAALRKQPSYTLYPTLWSTFLWTMGGFMLRDKEPDEHSWLSSVTGVPAAEIPEALKAFDLLFPNAWFRDRYNSHCRFVQFVPSAVQGLGAFHRMQHYKVKAYSELGYTDYTGGDLNNWHGFGYDLLKKRGSLKVSE